METTATSGVESGVPARPADRGIARLLWILIVAPFAVRPTVAVSTLSIPGPMGIEGLGILAGVSSLPLVLLPGSRGIRRVWLMATASAGALFVVAGFVEQAILRIPIHRATPLIQSIEAYEQAHGGPPRALDDLVPEFLDQVPSPGIRCKRGWDYHPPGWFVGRGQPGDWTIPPGQHDWYLRPSGDSATLDDWVLVYRADGRHESRDWDGPVVIRGWAFYPGDWN